MDPQVAALSDAGEIESMTLAEIPALLKAFIQAVPVTTGYPA
jgi:hypothetical protein